MPAVSFPLGRGGSWRPQLWAAVGFLTEAPVMLGLLWMARMALPYP